MPRSIFRGSCFLFLASTDFRKLEGGLFSPRMSLSLPLIKANSDWASLSKVVSLYLHVAIMFIKGNSVVHSARSLTLLTSLIICHTTLHFATLAYIPHSIHGLVDSLRLLPHGAVELYKYVIVL